MRSSRETSRFFEWSEGSWRICGGRPRHRESMAWLNLSSMVMAHFPIGRCDHNDQESLFQRRLHRSLKRVDRGQRGIAHRLIHRGEPTCFRVPPMMLNAVKHGLAGHSWANRGA